MTGFPYAKLSRWPDLEVDELLASDAADRMLVEAIAPALRDMVKEEGSESLRHALTVVGDSYGALTLSLLSELDACGVSNPAIRVHQDALAGQLALRNNAACLGVNIEHVAHHDLDAGLFRDARLVVLRLPRSLDQLDEWSACIAATASLDVTVYAGGRDKHMTLAMNDILARYFTNVSASHGRSKSRIITASVSRRAIAARAINMWPRRAHDVATDTHIAAFGGVFAGATVDIGTRALLDVLDRVPGQQNQRVIDFGCGTGVLAVHLARLRPTATIIATDQSAAAVRSASETMKANGLGNRVSVVHDEGLSLQQSESTDLIVFNPPFHSGAAVHAGTSLRLFAEAGRVLKPGGELWVVANRHLSYRPALRRLVGPTRTIRQTPKFTVTASTKVGDARTISSNGQLDARPRRPRARGLPNEPRLR